MKSFSQTITVSKPFAVVNRKNANTSMEYREGQYTFPNGVVDIYCQEDYFELRLVHNGKLHIKNFSDIKGQISDRKLICQAGIFAKEIVA